MRRTRSFALLLGAAGATAAAVGAMHRSHGPALGHAVAGGVVMGDAAAYDRHSRRLLRSFYRGVAADIARVAPTGARILEVGCGPGHLSMQMAGAHGLDVTGLDLDPAMIERAQGNIGRPDSAMGADSAIGAPTFVVGDVAALPFPDATFDLVVSTLSMHHWADPSAGLAEIGRVLRAGGRAMIWEFRPGVVPLHRHVPDPAEHARGSSLRVVGVTPWRWPWRFSLAQRIELMRDQNPTDDAET